MRRIFCIFLAFYLLLPFCFAEEAEAVDNWEPAEDIAVSSVAGSLSVPAPSVILMERSTGTVLYEKNADERLAPASITKVMTLLLAMEAIERGQLAYDQKVTVSRAAMSLGGSTAFLHEGERYTVSEMLKAVTIASANDGSVVLAEAVAGTEETFVAMMNERAAQLGMTGTNFTNCHGLDNPQHYTTARDVAIMSRALLAHKDIRNYSTVWLDSLRDGTFTLANTNRLVRYYDGCTGLKTGTTSKAGSCITASAERDGMELIAVVMHAASTDDRYESARKMLDYGFAGYSAMTVWPDEVLLPVPVLLGRGKEVQPLIEREETVIFEKHKKPLLTKTVELAEDVQAPVQKGQRLGEIILECEGTVLARVPIVAAADVEKLTWWDVLKHMLGLLTMSARPQ
ncbi:MAG: D-alanyl-D-alanine carboxypeptidase [Oscillospiraceae bacterium]|nr:D-alanyl-D-alanine carboxypeptidase [Oscillospiraceae bacterium]